QDADRPGKMAQGRRANAIRIDITRATTFARTAWDVGAGARFERMTVPLLNVWAVASVGAMLWDQYFHPPWRGWMFALLFASFAPILIGMGSAVSYMVRSKHWPDDIVR